MCDTIHKLVFSFSGFFLIPNFTVVQQVLAVGINVLRLDVDNGSLYIFQWKQHGGRPDGTRRCIRSPGWKNILGCDSNVHRQTMSVCKGCVQNSKQEHLSLWLLLPFIFCLPSWEELPQQITGGHLVHRCSMRDARTRAVQGGCRGPDELLLFSD